MSLLDTLADPNYRPSRGPNCSISLIMSGADKETAQLFAAALKNPHAPATEIAKAMAERGYPMPAHSLQRHRRGECRCGA
jgi:hypothetical protein